MKAKGFLFGAAAIALVAVSLFPSCKDTTGPCDAVITVTDSLGRRVQGASVTLRPDSSVYGPGSPQIDTSVVKTSVTDVVGNAYFTYRLEAVLIIDAAKGTFKGRDYIRLESAKSVSKTVIIR